ncbi:MAG: ABC transporter substrate-binding protein [Bacteroidetes bacterium]|nr:ABC transporter substrate-binding protein [Bacteroidota bacterium]
MKKIYYIVGIIVLAACGNPNGISHPEAAGGRIYGGTLKVNENDKYVSLYPHLITDVISLDIASQMYDGLVRIDAKNIAKILPDIAESWTMDESGTVYTFKLKKGVKFHDDACFKDGKGREVKASDFKYVFDLLFDEGEKTSFASTFKQRIKGGKEGVKAPDDYTLQITLASPTGVFLYLLAGSQGFVFPKEAVEKYGDESAVGTGPFILKNKDDEKLFLVRNPNYFRTDSLGNQLPFLDTIQVNFISDKAREMEAFKKEETHIIFGLPSSAVSEMVEQSLEDFRSKNPKYLLVRNPEMTSEYYEFNISKPPFNNLKVRQAFSYAMNRDKIISDALNTEAFGPGICGITPPGIPDYDITDIHGYNFNPEKAKKLFAEAGYSDGKKFPRITIELNSGGGKNVEVVEEIKKQLKEVLNVEVDYIVVPFARKIEDMKFSKAEIFRSAWVADYPNPENFLRTFYGGYVPDSLSKPSYPNTVRYKNIAYDSLVEKGFEAKNPEDGFSYYKNAEQILMNDAPIMILWYGENMKVIHSFVKNFYFNPMNYKDFSETYIQKNSPAEKP